MCKRQRSVWVTCYATADSPRAKKQGSRIEWHRNNASKNTKNKKRSGAGQPWRVHQGRQTPKIRFKASQGDLIRPQTAPSPQAARLSRTKLKNIHKNPIEKKKKKKKKTLLCTLGRLLLGVARLPAALATVVVPVPVLLSSAPHRNRTSARPEVCLLMLSC